MPIPVQCPNCQARANAPDAAAGRRVKCPKCQTPIAVPAAAAPPPEPEAAGGGDPFDFTAPAAPPKRSSGSAPRPPARPAPAPPPAAGGGFNFDDDATASEPRPGKRPPRRGDDDPTEVDDALPPARPGKRPPGKQQPAKGPAGKKSSPALVLILVGVGVVFLTCCIGLPVGAYFYLSSKAKDLGKELEKAMASSTEARSATRAAVPAGWKEFNAPDGSFKAYFPDEPQDAPGGPGPAGVDMKVYTSVSPAQQVVCMVGVISLKDLPAGDKDKVIDKMVEGMAGQPGAKVGARKDTTLAGKPATEVVVDLPEKGKKPKKGESGSKPQMVVRILKTDTTAYMVTIAGLTGRAKPEQENGFFDNFEATPK